MQLVITGGSGYLAGRIAQFFIKRKGNPFSLVTLATSSKQLIENSLYKPIDWDQAQSIKLLCEKADVIIHTAGFNLIESQNNPQASLRFSKHSTKLIVENINPERQTKLFYISTAHVYKSPLEGDLSESSQANNSHPYALSNLAGESEILKGIKEKGIQGLVLRLSNCFGYPVNSSCKGWGLVINEMCWDAVHKREIEIKDPRDSIRNFIPMQGFIDILDRLILENKKSYLNDIYNVGFYRAYTLTEMANIISLRCKKLFGFMPEIHIKSNEYLGLELNYYSNFIKTSQVVSDRSFYSEIDETLLKLNESIKQ